MSHYHVENLPCLCQILFDRLKQGLMFVVQVLGGPGLLQEANLQGPGRFSTQEVLITEALFQWSKAKGNRIRGRLSTCLMI